MEPKYQKAYAIEGIAQKWIEGENEDDYVDTGDMLDDFKLILELSRELMEMQGQPPKARLIYERLKEMLPSMEEEDLGEFCKGGISVCCAILGIENPYTGNKYGGDFTELL